MTVWKAIGVCLAAIAIIAPLLYLAWQSIYGGNQYTCTSNAYTFGCHTPAATFLGFAAAALIGVVLYFWGKFHGH